MKFLEQLAHHIMDKYGDELENLIVVLPNIRAKLFLTRYLAEQASTVIWLPEMMSSREFFESISGMRVVEDLTLMNMLQESLPDDMEEKRDAGLFLNWAPTLLQDLKELDHELADAEKIFKDLYNIREVESWSPEERPDVQSRYLKFCRDLPDIYRLFKEKMEASKMGHAGLVERLAAEKEAWVSKERPYLVAGFNALTAAESKTFNYLAEFGEAEFLFDYDRYYTEDEIHEAGLFARKNALNFKENPLQWTADHFSDVQKDISIYSCAHSIEQTYMLREILESRDQGDDLEDLVIVLPDENMLIPVLKQIPAHVQAINVTMGYSLKNSPFYSLFEALMRLYINADLRKSRSFYHADVRRLLRNEALNQLLNDEQVERRNHYLANMDRYNRVYLPPDEVAGLLKADNSSFSLPLFPVNKSIELIALFNEWIQFIDRSMREREEHWVKIQREFLLHHHEVNVRLQENLNQLEGEMSLADLHKVWKRLTDMSKVQFTGEPLRGMQVMGLLETRNLDFKEVVILNANEGKLPSSRNYNSMLPFDLKRQHDLLVHRDRDAIFAYHFYRLLQRASKAHILYHTNQGDMGGGELSRYVRQLKKELPEYQGSHIISSFSATPGPSTTKIEENAVIMDEDIREKMRALLSEGLSPTALTTYLNCPLDFYYRYIIGLRQEDEVAEVLESDVLGSVIHQCLEEILKSQIGQQLTSDYIRSMAEEVPAILEKSFAEHIDPKHLKSGKNLLTFNIAQHYLKDFIEADAQRVENERIELLALEEHLTTSTEPDGFAFKGVLDRMERSGNLIRIIDYKTGMLTASELSFKSMEELFGGKKNKALQLMLYAYIVFKGGEADQLMEAGIYSLRDSRSGLIKLKLGKETVFGESHFKQFEEYLLAFIQEMLSREDALRHNDRSLYCELC